MEDGDNVGGANNDVGEGASSGVAADPSAPSDGAAAAAGAGGGVNDNNSSPVVEVGNGCVELLFCRNCCRLMSM